VGGGGGDGDGERACLDDLGLALREAEGEPSGFGFGSGLFVSLEEASGESDFGLMGSSVEEGRGEGERSALLVERGDLPFWPGEG